MTGMLVETVPHRPHPALRPFVATITGYRQEGLPPGVHRGLPSPHLTLILTLDEPMFLSAHSDPGQPPGTYEALVGGLHLQPVMIAHPGRQSGVQVSLTPLGARALLGMPAAELFSYDADLADVVRGPAADLVGRFRAAAGWPARFAVIEDALLRLNRSAELAPEVAEAWRLTTTTHGRFRVEEIARRVGWSSRYLGDRFRAEIGLTPKESARIARFHLAHRRLSQRASLGQPADLAGLAAGCGYYDQAHLAREWRSLVGLPPSGWLAEEFGFVQANGAG